MITFNCMCIQVKIWFQNRRMKWKRSRKAKEQAAQGEAERQRVGTRPTNERPGRNGRRTSGMDDELDKDIDEEDEEYDEEDREKHKFTNNLNIHRSTDYLHHTAELGYHPDTSFSDDDMDEVGADRKIGVGL